MLNAIQLRAPSAAATLFIHVISLVKYKIAWDLLSLIQYEMIPFLSLKCDHPFPAPSYIAGAKYRYLIALAGQLESPSHLE